MKKKILCVFHSVILSIPSFPSQRTFFPPLNSVGSIFERKPCFQTVHSSVDVGSGKVNTVWLHSLFVDQRRKKAFKVKRLIGALGELDVH